jgi:hypothetical protein
VYGRTQCLPHHRHGGVHVWYSLQAATPIARGQVNVLTTVIMTASTRGRAQQLRAMSICMGVSDAHALPHARLCRIPMHMPMQWLLLPVLARLLHQRSAPLPLPSITTRMGHPQQAQMMAYTCRKPLHTSVLTHMSAMRRKCTPKTRLSRPARDHAKIALFGSTS